jgi:hypothetical protein
MFGMYGILADPEPHMDSLSRVNMDGSHHRRVFDSTFVLVS